MDDEDPRDVVARNEGRVEMVLTAIGFALIVAAAAWLIYASVMQR